MNLLSSNRLFQALFVSSWALLTYAMYNVFLVVPNERFMGPVQRIFYFHVGCAIACYVAFGVLLIASLGYLATRSQIADAIAQAAGEVGCVFCSIVMVTGMIWGHSAWNTWFNWEPRLITFLILLLISLAYVLLRSFANPATVASHCSILGILAAVSVPLVWLSVKFLPSMSQLHPIVVENRGLKDPSFTSTMFLSMGALVLFLSLLLMFRIRLELLSRNLESHGHRS